MKIQEALPAGTVILLDGQQYKLGPVTGSGGSCLFYSAKKEGSALPCGVKECCPSALSGRLRREGGVLAGTDGEAARALSDARARMLGEAEVSQRVAALSHRAIPVWDAPAKARVAGPDGGAPAPAGSFLVMQRVSAAGWFLRELLEECALPSTEGRPLRTGGLPRLAVTARIIQETLRALDPVHRAGYLYGDIHPGNLFFADPRPETGYIGTACLIDFGCSRPLVDGERTAPISDRMVFTTPGYTAPEIALYNDGNLRLTQSADLYSVGRLMLCLLKGQTFYERGRDRMLGEGYLLSRLYPDEGEWLGCGGSDLRLAQSILDWSLALDPDDRYQTVGEMLADVDELVRRTAPPPNRLALAFSTLGEGRFLGREDLMDRIETLLDREEKPVVLWGFAGMGKTELAIAFASRWQERRGNAHFVRFQGSVRRTVIGPIADSFSGYDRKDAAGREKPEEQIYREVMKLLAQRDERELLVLDNMDGEDEFAVLRGEDAFRELCALPMKLLVTTRSPAEDGIEVNELPKPLLRRLMRQNMAQTSARLSDEMADALINAVEGNTLTVDIIGRTLEHSVPRLTPEAVLEKLRQGELDSAAFAKVSSPKDRAGRMARIQGHLTALFRLSQLPEEELQMLALALPISAEGLLAEDLARAPRFDQNALLRLIDRGWIRRSEGDVLTLHPLVRETGLRELTLNVAALIAFIGTRMAMAGIDLSCASERTRQYTGYAANLIRCADDARTRTEAADMLCQELEEQGRYRESLFQARALWKWLEELPKEKQDAACSRRALLLIAGAHEKLGEEEWAAVFREEARTSAAPALEPELSAEEAEDPSTYLRLGVSPLEAEMQARSNRLIGLMNGGRFEDALQAYRESRKWFLDHGLDTSFLDSASVVIFEKLGDPKLGYLALRELCGEFSRGGKRVIPIHVKLFTILFQDEVILGRLKAARAVMMDTLRIIRQLPADAQKEVFRNDSKTFLSIAWKQGWTEEAAAWLMMEHTETEGYRSSTNHEGNISG